MTSPAEEIVNKKASGIYIVVDRIYPHSAYEMFKSYTQNNKQGLIISKKHPSDIENMHNPKNAQLIWMTETRTDNTVKPQLESIGSELENKEYSIALLDGAEFLAEHSGYETFDTFLNMINDTLSVKKKPCLVPIYPDAYDKKYFELLKRNLKSI